MNLARLNFCLSHEDPEIIKKALSIFSQQILSENHALASFGYNSRSYSESEQGDESLELPVTTRGLLATYIASAPKLEEFFVVWDLCLSNEGDNTELSMALIQSISVILHCSARSQSTFCNNIVARIVQEKSKSVQGHLGSGQIPLIHTTLGLLISMCRTSLGNSIEIYQKMMNQNLTGILYVLSQKGKPVEWQNNDETVTLRTDSRFLLSLLVHEILRSGSKDAVDALLARDSLLRKLMNNINYDNNETAGAILSMLIKITAEHEDVVVKGRYALVDTNFLKNMIELGTVADENVRDSTHMLMVEYAKAICFSGKHFEAQSSTNKGSLLSANVQALQLLGALQTHSNMKHKEVQTIVLAAHPQLIKTCMVNMKFASEAEVTMQYVGAITHLCHLVNETELDSHFEFMFSNLQKYQQKKKSSEISLGDQNQTQTQTHHSTILGMDDSLDSFEQEIRSRKSKDIHNKKVEDYVRYLVDEIFDTLMPKSFSKREFTKLQNHKNSYIQRLGFIYMASILKKIESITKPMKSRYQLPVIQTLLSAAIRERFPDFQSFLNLRVKYLATLKDDDGKSSYLLNLVHQIMGLYASLFPSAVKNSKVDFLKLFDSIVPWATCAEPAADVAADIVENIDPDFIRFTVELLQQATLSHSCRWFGSGSDVKVAITKFVSDSDTGKESSKPTAIAKLMLLSAIEKVDQRFQKVSTAAKALLKLVMEQSSLFITHNVEQNLNCEVNSWIRSLSVNDESILFGDLVLRTSFHFTTELTIYSLNATKDAKEKNASTILLSPLMCMAVSFVCSDNISDVLSTPIQGYSNSFAGVVPYLSRVVTFTSQNVRDSHNYGVVLQRLANSFASTNSTEWAKCSEMMTKLLEITSSESKKAAVSSKDKAAGKLSSKTNFVGPCEIMHLGLSLDQILTGDGDLDSSKLANVNASISNEIDSFWYLISAVYFKDCANANPDSSVLKWIAKRVHQDMNDIVDDVSDVSTRSLLMEQCLCVLKTLSKYDGFFAVADSNANIATTVTPGKRKKKLDVQADSADATIEGRKCVSTFISIALECARLGGAVAPFDLSDPTSLLVQFAVGTSYLQDDQPKLKREPYFNLDVHLPSTGDVNKSLSDAPTFAYEYLVHSCRKSAGYSSASRASKTSIDIDFFESLVDSDTMGITNQEVLFARGFSGNSDTKRLGRSHFAAKEEQVYESLKKIAVTRRPRNGSTDIDTDVDTPATPGAFGSGSSIMFGLREDGPFYLCDMAPFVGSALRTVLHDLDTNGIATAEELLKTNLLQLVRMSSETRALSRSVVDSWLLMLKAHPKGKGKGSDSGSSWMYRAMVHLAALSPVDSLSITSGSEFMRFEFEVANPKSSKTSTSTAATSSMFSSIPKGEEVFTEVVQAALSLQGPGKGATEHANELLDNIIALALHNNWYQSYLAERILSYILLQQDSVVVTATEHITLFALLELKATQSDHSSLDLGLWKGVFFSCLTWNVEKATAALSDSNNLDSALRLKSVQYLLALWEDYASGQEKKEDEEKVQGLIKSFLEQAVVMGLTSGGVKTEVLNLLRLYALPSVHAQELFELLTSQPTFESSVGQDFSSIGSNGNGADGDLLQILLLLVSTVEDLTLLSSDSVDSLVEALVAEYTGTLSHANRLAFRLMHVLSEAGVSPPPSAMCLISIDAAESQGSGDRASGLESGLVSLRLATVGASLSHFPLARALNPLSFEVEAYEAAKARAGQVGKMAKSAGEGWARGLKKAKKDKKDKKDKDKTGGKGGPDSSADEDSGSESGSGQASDAESQDSDSDSDSSESDSSDSGSDADDVPGSSAASKNNSNRNRNRGNIDNKLAYLGASSTVYDPAFAVPALHALLNAACQTEDEENPRQLLSVRKIISSGALSYIIAALGSVCPFIRGYALSCLSMTHSLINAETKEKDAHFRERPQMLLLINFLRNSIDSGLADDREAEKAALSVPRVPPTLAIFLGRGVLHLLQVSHSLYGATAKYLLSRPYGDYKDVPLFDLLVVEGDVHTQQANKLAVLRVVRDSLSTKEDHLNMCRKHAYQRLMCLFPIVSRDQRVGHVILDVIDKALSLRVASRYVLERCNVLSWIQQTVTAVKFAVAPSASAEVNSEVAATGIASNRSLGSVKFLPRFVALLRKAVGAMDLLHRSEGMYCYFPAAQATLLSLAHETARMKCPTRELLRQLVLAMWELSRVSAETERDLGAAVCARCTWDASLLKSLLECVQQVFKASTSTKEGNEVTAVVVNLLAFDSSKAQTQSKDKDKDEDEDNKSILRHICVVSTVQYKDKEREKEGDIEKKEDNEHFLVLDRRLSMCSSDLYTPPIVTSQELQWHELATSDILKTGNSLPFAKDMNKKCAVNAYSRSVLRLLSTGSTGEETKEKQVCADVVRWALIMRAVCSNGAGKITHDECSMLSAMDGADVSEFSEQFISFQVMIRLAVIALKCLDMADLYESFPKNKTVNQLKTTSKPLLLQVLKSICGEGEREPIDLDSRIRQLWQSADSGSRHLWFVLSQCVLEVISGLVTSQDNDNSSKLGLLNIEALQELVDRVGELELELEQEVEENENDNENEVDETTKISTKIGWIFKPRHSNAKSAEVLYGM